MPQQLPGRLSAGGSVRPRSNHKTHVFLVLCFGTAVASLALALVAAKAQVRGPLSRPAMV